MTHWDSENTTAPHTARELGAEQVKTAQVNVRVPEGAREALLSIASRLRDDPSFIDALSGFISGMPPIGVGLTLSERIARIAGRLGVADALRPDPAPGAGGGEMIGMTLCSGIGAPEVAAPWVDWRLASEIEAFPRAVLQHRLGYKASADHNQGDPLLWGDLREVNPDLLRRHGVPLPNIVVAGTPCQAFSVAGARKGLEDPRGNLTLAFVDLLHAIVAARPDGKLAVLWENVPGVLSDKGNAFGCFLGGLVGSLDAIPAPSGGSWAREGMVEGSRSRAAWAVLDAQWFGVAQRRERVFVVVDLMGHSIPQRYYLSQTACGGILRRAEKRGKALPEALNVALKAVASSI